MTDDGGVYAVGPCCLCAREFLFNPELVPSIPVDDAGRITPEGMPRPLCHCCVIDINEFREFMGADPIYVLPGAYEVGAP
jgi:hypothetical protein